MIRFMSFGPESKDADAVYLAAFEHLGPCLEHRQLKDGDGGLDGDFLAAWLRRAEQTGWIRRDGEQWCITTEGEVRHGEVRRELGISHEIAIGLPAHPRRSRRLWRSDR